MVRFVTIEEQNRGSAAIYSPTAKITLVLSEIHIRCYVNRSLLATAVSQIPTVMHNPGLDHRWVFAKRMLKKDQTVCPARKKPRGICEVSRRRLSFPKIPPRRIRAMRQNQRIILRDACIPSAACDVCRQPVQVAAPA
jgi:hypothetical protein